MTTPLAAAPVLLRPAPVATGAGGPAGAALDADQRRVVDHPRGGGPMVVLGAPGTGKTTALVEALVARVERDGAPASALLVLAPGRRAAGQLRDRLSARLARTTTEPLARTPHAYAWALLRRAAVHAGAPPPRLLTGPEQDQVLAELLAGHERGDGRVPVWPASVPPAVRRLAGFRAELRDVLMRALEHGLAPGQLAHLGRARGRPAWVAAADVMAEYLQVVALASAGAHDPAAVVGDAAALLRADPALLAAERARWALVAVEDHQESTAATADLLDLLTGGGGDLLVVGDPDATTSGFRGGDPALLAGAAERHRGAGGGPAPVVVLGTRHRGGPALAAVSRRIAARTGSAGAVRHRGALPAAPPDGTADAADAAEVVEAHVLRSPAQQAAFVAAVLREEGVVRGTPWRQMAVVVRSAGSTASLRRALAGAGVPVRLPTAEVPLRAEAAAAPLLGALRVVVAHPAPPSAEEVLALLAGPLGGADALGVRRLRQVLLAEERAGGGARGSDALLVDAVGAPERCASLPARAARPALALARVLAAGRAAAAARGSAEEVLWALWSASGLAAPWQRRALAGGAGGERADRDLDAVVALFDAAARYEEREPGAPPARFLEHLAAQDVPADTLAARGSAGGAVELATPQSAAGREWDVVVVAGLQEGAWPDVRLRGTLLGAPELADELAGRSAARPGGAAGAAAARRAVLDDEHRLLHVAATRARRRLVATAVSSDDERPSAFLDLVAPRPGPEPRACTPVPRAVSLPALVAELRAVLLAADGARDGAGARVDAARRAAAAASLAQLAAAGVPGADPASWYGLAALSDDAPLRPADAPVPVRPSAVEAFGRCGLRWVLEESGGRAETLSQGVGVLVHQVAQELPGGTAAQMRARLEELWPQLGLPTTWVGQREHRRAVAVVARLAGYVDAARAAGRDLLAVEVEVEAVLGRAVVRGRLDRLERTPDGGVRVVDLKTGSTSPRAADLAAHPQLGVYQVLVTSGALDHVPGALADGAAGPARSGGAALVQVGGTRAAHAEQPQVPLHDAPDPAWAADLLARTADGMAGAAFPAAAGDTCTRCPVRTCCPLRPEGRQVVP